MMLNFMTAICTSMLVPVFPLWIKNVLRVSPDEIFYIMGIIGLGSFVLNIFIGHLTDIIGRKKTVIQIQLLLNCVRSLIYGLFPFTPIVIGISWITQMSGGALIFAILSEKISENNDQDNKSLINATVRMGVSIGYIFGPSIGIFIISLVSYINFFLLYALLYALLILMVHYLISDKANRTYNNEVHNDKTKQKRSLSHPFKIILTVIFPLLLFIGVQSNSSLLALHIDKEFGEWVLPIIFGMGPLFEILAFPLIGLLSDKIGVKVTVFIGVILEILYFLIMGTIENIFIIIPVQILGSFFVAIFFSTLMIYIQDKFINRVGFSTSLYFGTVSISGTIGNFVLGAVISEESYNVGFLILCLISIIGLLTYIVLEYKNLWNMPGLLLQYITKNK